MSQCCCLLSPLIISSHYWSGLSCMAGSVYADWRIWLEDQIKGSDWRIWLEDLIGELDWKIRHGDLNWRIRLIKFVLFEVFLSSVKFGNLPTFSVVCKHPTKLSSSSLLLNNAPRVHHQCLTSNVSLTRTKSDSFLILFERMSLLWDFFIRTHFLWVQLFYSASFSYHSRN